MIVHVLKANILDYMNAIEKCIHHIAKREEFII